MTRPTVPPNPGPDHDAACRLAHGLDRVLHLRFLDARDDHVMRVVPDGAGHRASGKTEIRQQSVRDATGTAVALQHCEKAQVVAFQDLGPDHPLGDVDRVVDRRDPGHRDADDVGARWSGR